MITVEYHGDLKEVQSDAALMALASAPHAAAPFDRIEWWEGLAEHCGMAPLIAVVREGEARAVLPLMARNGGLESLANWYSFRVRPLVTPGADDARLLTALGRDLARRTARLHLSPLPDEHGETTLLARALRHAGWAVFVTRADTNRFLELGGRSYADYVAGRPGPLRTTLKRKAGRVEIRIATAFDPGDWAAYEAIYRESWKPEEGSPAFLRGFAEAEGAAGRLRLGIARAGGEPIAAQLWTVEHGTAFIHKLAHREAAKALSPGTSLTAALFERVIDRDRVTAIDFGTGDDRYKADWIDTARPRWRIEAWRPGNPRAWPGLAKAILRRLARRDGSD